MSRALIDAGREDARSIRAALANVRVKDVIVLQGPPIMGVAFGWATSRPQELWMLPVFLLASCLLVAHVFCLNDWAGIETDHHDTNKASRTFLAQGASQRVMAWLTLGLGALSLCLFGLLSGPTFLAALCLIVLSLLYSHPFVGVKGIPILSSVLHAAGGVLHFLLGYSLCATIDLRAILVGIYLGVVFAAGHLTQEVGDYEADKLNGIRTNAVTFGQRSAFVAAFLLFSVAYAMLVGLAYVGVVPRALMGVAVLYPVQVLLFRRALLHDLTFERVSSYRSHYRLIHVLVGLVICAALLAEGLSP